MHNLNRYVINLQYYKGLISKNANAMLCTSITSSEMIVIFSDISTLISSTSTFSGIYFCDISTMIIKFFAEYLSFPKPNSSVVRRNFFCLQNNNSVSIIFKHIKKFFHKIKTSVKSFSFLIHHVLIRFKLKIQKVYIFWHSMYNIFLDFYHKYLSFSIGSQNPHKSKMGAVLISLW